MYVVNGYFRQQEVTGQQRYATEIANRLPALLDPLTEIRAASPWAANRHAAWIDLQIRLPYLARGQTLISLTSRAPALARRHLVTVHDLFPIVHPEWFSDAYAALHRRLLTRLLRTAAGIITVSDPVRDQIRAHVGRDVAIVVAPNAAATPFAGTRDRGSPDPDDSFGDTLVIEGRRLSPGQFFLAVGSLEPRKNLNTLVSAYGRLPGNVRGDYPLVLVGGSYKAFRPSAQATVDGVVYAGRVQDAALAGLYRTALAFISVSLDEGFGIPLVEAAACGVRRLIVSDIPVYRWLVGHGDDVEFVGPSSVDSIAAALERATRQPLAGREFTRLAARFTWDASAATIAEFARQL